MIKVEDLTMKYGPFTALSNVSFEVKPGEVVGLLGPNGAGKSTAMKIITTYLYPTSGQAIVGGHSCAEDPLAVRRLIGYLPEILPLYMEMEVRNYPRFVGVCRGLSGQDLKRRLEWVVDNCGLALVYRKIIRELSKGYKQRTGLAQALIHDPEVLILDEPTSGLDPLQILEIRKLIRRLAKDKTVILSTHILQEVEAISDRLVIINRGQIVGNGTVAQLEAQTKEFDRAIIRLNAPVAEAEAALGAISGVIKSQRLGASGQAASFELTSVKGSGAMAQAGQLALARGWAVTELREPSYPLEAIFIALTKRQAAKEA